MNKQTTKKRAGKRLLGILLSLVMMASLLPAVPLVAGAAPWDGTTDKAWYIASPSNLNFTINTAAELAGLAEIVNDGTDNFEGKTITLNSAIDLGRIDDGGNSKGKAAEYRDKNSLR